MLGTAALSVLIGTFVASSVEVTEMVIIVVGVGATRGWRSTWIGVIAGLVVLVGIIAGLGQALSLIPIGTVRIVIGALLLTFGLQWYRKGVIQTAADGFTGGTEEEEVGAGGRGGGVDWTAFVLAFKGVLLEGLEVAFIVVAFGAGGGSGGTSTAGSGSYRAAYVGAAAAFVVIGILGFVAKRRLQKVPGRTLKFGVGGLLTTFGTFWALEGLGVHWPGNDLSLAWLYAAYLSSTFLMMLAVRAGWLGRVPATAVHDPGPAGPSGLAPASEISTRSFQTDHGLAEDGVVGPRTQAAVRAVRAECHDGLDPVAVGVDPGDPQAIRATQQRLGLPVSGQIDGLTRGTLRLLQHPGFVDPLDEDAVCRFQRDHGLEPTGSVGEDTRVAIVAVLGDHASGGTREGGQPGPSPGGQSSSSARNLVACFGAIDPIDSRSVRRFQESLGISQSGDIDAETRGAMRGLRAWLLGDPTRSEVIQDLQRRHGLTADGVIGPQTRAALAEEREHAIQTWTAPPISEPDAFDEASVRAFQRRHALAEDGTIGSATRQRIAWEREHNLSMDAADAESVRHFQRGHGLKPDGVVGEQTRAALLAARHERESSREGERGERDGADPAGGNDGQVLDPADAESVRHFQRGHGLKPDGVIGSRTQTVMHSVAWERQAYTREPSEAQSEAGGSSVIRRIGQAVVGFGRFWYDFIIGDDWVAAAGVLVMIGGAYVLLKAGVPAYWFGPTAILTTAAVTIQRALRRQTDN
jgi:uncharacterized membrane protein/peptidoglycan hydrolase-like protein with peptidoglycan-binding domain